MIYENICPAEVTKYKLFESKANVCLFFFKITGKVSKSKIFFPLFLSKI